MQQKISDILKFEYKDNILHIYLPDDLKIKFHGNVHQDITGKYIINASKQVDIISHKESILLDSHPEHGIHLNSYISKFSKHLKYLYNKLYG